VKKKQTEVTPKTSLKLRTETLRRLDDSKLQGAVGGARNFVPTGVADTTTTDETTG
jgi:hypothetical protein